MKKIFALLFLPLFLIACDKDGGEANPFKDNYSDIYIYGRDNTNKAASQQRMTVHEIMTHGKIGLWYDNNNGSANGIAYSFENGGLDTINDRIIMLASNVIENERMNEWGGALLKSRNYYITLEGERYERLDTVAYIPNDVIRDAQARILDLWVEGRIAEIYELFNNTFYFTPCTAEEFKQLKEPIDWEHEFDNIPQHEDTWQIRWDGDWNGEKDPTPRPIYAR